MRQIFTSQRVETVEGVAQLLEQAGIDTYISNGRSYQGKRGSQFSYSDPIAKAKQPAVWVRRADDQPKAREILREHGLLESTRPDLPRPLISGAADEDAGTRPRWALRLRLVLLSLIVAAAAFTFLRHRAMQDEAKRAAAAAAAAAQQQAAPPDTGLKDDEERVRIPTLPPAAPPR
ncbi:Putative signal transducing protein [Pseudoxanthomonas sp. GM95]|uniref:putative signal transducing protein n=1 Tax=Pseudoxanthomonas sp. GM95 TaxID=1881043 RepID=UPI0008C6746E|nr:DUF2007 domain-containing protein [Pseudoxanthomonas sp. GM95]SEK79734.1 Putative signal transducing protein [Pseudoxanthomonas sp. GM95]